MLILATLSIKGQQISIEVGKNISSFEYSNSLGENLENLQSTNNSFINLGYRRTIFTQRLFLNAKALYNTYGATGSDQILDNYYAWEASYLGPGLGLEYEIVHLGDFVFSLKGEASAEFLIQGTQKINHQVYNLTNEGDFDSSIYFLRAGVNFQYKINDRLDVFTQYMYGESGSFENNSGDLTITSHNLGVGLLLNISKKNQVTQLIDSTQYNELKIELERNSKKIEVLEDQSNQVTLLQQEIVNKELEIATIKESITRALRPYQGDDLKIKEVDGIIYITMGNDMLFDSGSAKISSEGKNTINEIADVLAENTDLNILIEGHTDNQAFKNNIMTNWELSVKRATAVVDIFETNENIDPKKLMAAGRGEFYPIASNDTEEGRATNRRIEIIISPKLDEISKAIKN